MDHDIIGNIAFFSALGLFATCACMVIVSRVAARMARLEGRVMVLEIVVERLERRDNRSNVVPLRSRVRPRLLANDPGDSAA